MYHKPFYFGADPDHDPDPGIFNGTFTIGNRLIVTFSASNSINNEKTLRETQTLRARSL